MFNWIRNRVSSPKVDIQVQLNDVKTYTNRDHVNGAVILKVADNRITPFSKLDIELIGISTFIIRAQSASTGAPYKLEHYERFLELEQPNAISHTPMNRVLKAGVRYDVPFDFTLPERILATNCVHHGQTHEQHTHLPPTLEDCGEEFDRSCAGGVAIRYRVVARLWQATDHEDDTQKELIAIKGVNVHIVPSIPVEHPVATSTLDDYILHKRISLKNKVSTKDNRLSISAIEPKPVPLPLSEGGNTDACSTILPITLHFDGGNEFARPPKLGKLKIDLQVETFLRSTCRYNGQWNQSPTKTVNLPSRSAASVVWNKHCLGLGSCDVHDQLSPATSPLIAIQTTKKQQCSTPNQCYHNSCCRANIAVPVVLSQVNSLVPTFQTCSIWRRYRLILSLDVQCMPLGRARTVVLEVPLHIFTQTPTIPRSSQVSGGISSDALVGHCTNQYPETDVFIGGEESKSVNSMVLEPLPEYVVREYRGRIGSWDVRPFR